MYENMTVHMKFKFGIWAVVLEGEECEKRLSADSIDLQMQMICTDIYCIMTAKCNSFNSNKQDSFDLRQIVHQ